MKIEFQLTGADLDEATEGQRPFWNYHLLCAGCLLIGLALTAGAVYAFVDSQPRNPIPALFILFIAGQAWYGVYYYWGRAARRSHTIIASHVEYDFDENRIKATVDGQFSEGDWSIFTGYREMPHLFVLKQGATSLPIPKRALTSVSIDDFRTLLNRKLLKKRSHLFAFLLPTRHH